MAPGDRGRRVLEKYRNFVSTGTVSTSSRTRLEEVDRRHNGAGLDGLKKQLDELSAGKHRVNIEKHENGMEVDRAAGHFGGSQIWCETASVQQGTERGPQTSRRVKEELDQQQRALAGTGREFEDEQRKVDTQEKSLLVREGNFCLGHQVAQHDLDARIRELDKREQELEAQERSMEDREKCLGEQEEATKRSGSDLQESVQKNQEVIQQLMEDRVKLEHDKQALEEEIQSTNSWFKLREEQLVNGLGALEQEMAREVGEAEKQCSQRVRDAKMMEHDTEERLTHLA